MDLDEISATGPVETLMHTAVLAVDAEFGDGYAAANPVLVAGYMQATIAQAANNLIADRIGAALDVVNVNLSDIRERLAHLE